MTATFSIPHGANGPTLDATLTKGDGTAQDLTAATVVLYLERRGSGKIWLNGESASIVDAATGKVRYSWKAGDWTALEGDVELGDGVYRGQWHVTGISAAPVRFPTAHPGYFLVLVLPKVS